MQLDQYAGWYPPPLADYAWLWMARRSPGSQNRPPLDSMHVRYYTVFSVYLFYARRAPAHIRNHAWNMCSRTYGCIRSQLELLYSSMDFLLPTLFHIHFRLINTNDRNNWILEKVPFYLFLKWYSRCELLRGKLFSNFYSRV